MKTETNTSLTLGVFPEYTLPFNDHRAEDMSEGVKQRRRMKQRRPSGFLDSDYEEASDDSDEDWKGDGISTGKRKKSQRESKRSRARTTFGDRRLKRTMQESDRLQPSCDLQDTHNNAVHSVQQRDSSQMDRAKGSLLRIDADMHDTATVSGSNEVELLRKKFVVMEATLGTMIAEYMKLKQENEQLVMRIEALEEGKDTSRGKDATRITDEEGEGSQSSIRTTEEEEVANLTNDVVDLEKVGYTLNQEMEEFPQSVVTLSTDLVIDQRTHSDDEVRFHTF